MRVGESAVGLSWGPVKKKGAKLKLGHWVGMRTGVGREYGNDWTHLPLFDQGDARACVAAGHEGKHHSRICHFEG